MHQVYSHTHTQLCTHAYIHDLLYSVINSLFSKAHTLLSSLLHTHLYAHMHSHSLMHSHVCLHSHLHSHIPHSDLYLHTLTCTIAYSLAHIHTHLYSYVHAFTLETFYTWAHGCSHTGECGELHTYCMPSRKASHGSKHHTISADVTAHDPHFIPLLIVLWLKKKILSDVRCVMGKPKS